MGKRIVGIIALLLSASICLCSLPSIADESYDEYDDYEAYDYADYEDYGSYDETDYYDADYEYDYSDQVWEYLWEDEINDLIIDDAAYSDFDADAADQYEFFDNDPMKFKTTSQRIHIPIRI